MFSATWPKEVQTLAREYLQGAIQVTVGSLEVSANIMITQKIEVRSLPSSSHSLLNLLCADLLRLRKAPEARSLPREDLCRVGQGPHLHRDEARRRRAHQVPSRGRVASARDSRRQAATGARLGSRRVQEWQVRSYAQIALLSRCSCFRASQKSHYDRYGRRLARTRYVSSRARSLYFTFRPSPFFSLIFF